MRIERILLFFARLIRRIYLISLYTRRRKKNQQPSEIQLHYEVLPTVPTNLLKYRALVCLEHLISQHPLWRLKVVLPPPGSKRNKVKSSQCFLCRLTMNKRVSRSESSCNSDQYETRSLSEDKTLRVLSKRPSRRRERNSAESNALTSLAKNWREFSQFVMGELVSHRHFYIPQNSTSRY